MPFVSKAQRKWMYANDPKLAAKFQRETSFTEQANLPDKVASVKPKNKPSNFSKASGISKKKEFDFKIV